MTELSASTGALVQVISASGYGFSDPVAISSDGTHVWVANFDGNSVTELSASTGALVQVISGSSYGFDAPDAISSDGTDVWVANADGNSVTELSASTGALVQVISGSSYGFNGPDAISSDGTHVWVANRRQLGDRAERLDGRPGPGDLGLELRVRRLPTQSPPTGPTSGWRTRQGNSVTELSASTGALVRIISGSRYEFHTPDAISSDGTHVWVSSLNQGGSVTELSASTGALVRVVWRCGYGFGRPDAVSSDGTDVWVANSDGHSVTELSASTGALVRNISGSEYEFHGPDAISSDGTDVWVANAAGPFGDRAERLDRDPGPGLQGLELRVQRSRRHLLRRDRRLGGELRGRVRDRCSRPEVSKSP